MSDFGSLADRFEALVADIDDLSFDLLSEAVADGATARPAWDKDLVKARRAAEKATAVLRSLADQYPSGR